MARLARLGGMYLILNLYVERELLMEGVVIASVQPTHA
jgi:hypothetical protein